jgi:hypothetical protein
LKGLLEDASKEADEATLVALQEMLANGMMDELRRNHEALEINEDQDFIVRYDAEYYHSRFDTVIRLLPAPHLEMDLDYLQELQSDGKIFVKYFMIPVGVCEEGLWIRLFDGQTDTTGRLIKLEHDSILGYPATAPREVGRISHIEGNPHFVIRVAVSAHGENGLEFHDANVWDQRSYPHLLETLQAKKATHADEWEKAMRTVTYNQANFHKVHGLEKEHLLALKHLSSPECTSFDQLYEI